MTNTTESKIDATDRLRREGRWEEAQQYRDEVRKKLLADGKKRAEAREASWDAMLEKYPPVPIASESAAQDGELPPEWFEAGTPDLSRDFLWAYAALGNNAVQPSNAPGPGAWNLLQWARSNTSRFFDQFASRATALLARADEDRRREEEERLAADRSGSRLDTILADLQAEMAGELARNTPAKVEAKVRERVQQWEESHGIDMPDEASRELASAMVSIVDDCIELVLADPQPFLASRQQHDNQVWGVGEPQNEGV